MSNILTRNAINKDFSRNPEMFKKRSKFKMAHRRLQTMNGAWIVPIYLKRTIPGDTFEINMNLFARLMPQVAPCMDSPIIKTYFFWERCANLWENFPKMMGERNNPGDSISYTVPTVTIPEGGFGDSTIFDYLKVPIKTGEGRKLNAMPFRMYNRIFNKYFRSEQLQNELTEKHDDSDDSYTLYNLVKKCKTPDYFTRNLIDTQLGESVSLPIGGVAQVKGNGLTLGMTDGTNNFGTTMYSMSMFNSTSNAGFGQPIGSSYEASNQSEGKAIGVTTDGTKSGLIADLSNATMANIIALRQAMAMQVTLEHDNRCGTRYTEILQSRYGVTVPDAFMNRPLYLGGTAKPMTTIPITQTSSTDETTPQGNLTGNTIFSEGANVVTASFPDFGYVMGLAVISTEPQYQQGLDRLYDEKDRFDFMHPEFNYVGDQATYNSEIYLQDEDVVDEDGTPINNKVFGYNERLADLKSSINEICGKMRSNAEGTLDVWHYARNYENLPTLNDEFMEDEAEEVIARSLAVQYETDENGNVLDGTEGKDLKYATQCLFDAQFETIAYRGIPVYNLPSSMGLIY